MEEKLAALDLPKLKIRERIKIAVLTRLALLAPNKEAARRAAALLTLPMHAARGAKMMYRTVDAMWRAAGDTSTDFNFYTKRGILAGRLWLGAGALVQRHRRGRKRHRSLPRRPHRECDAVREIQGEGEGSLFKLPRLHRLGKTKSEIHCHPRRTSTARGDGEGDPGVKTVRVFATWMPFPRTRSAALGRE